MHNQKLNFPLMNKERLEERLSHIKTSDLHDAKTARLYNYLHADLGELNRRRLVSLYEITIDDFGNYATIGRAHRLLLDGVIAVANYLADLRPSLETRGTGDDGSDYLNAAADQLSFLAGLNADFDEKADEAALLSVLNATEEATINDSFTDAMAFRYGYADHGSPISDLAFMNYEDI